MDELREKIAGRFKSFTLAISEGSLEGTKLECEREAKEIVALVKEAGYVRLSQDQSLPNKPPYLTLAQGGYKQALVDICEAGWRKVEL